MTFYRLVVEDHLKDVLDAYKMGKLTHEQAIRKINKTAQYLYTHERYTTGEQKIEGNKSDFKADKDQAN